MLYTIHYDGPNLESENCTDDFIDAYYDKYPFHKACDVLESESSDLVTGYYQILAASDTRLSISHVEVYIDRQWVNIDQAINNL